MTEAAAKLNEPQPADWPHERISLLECIALNNLSLLSTTGDPVIYIAKDRKSALATNSADVVFRGEPVKLYFSTSGDAPENIPASRALGNHEPAGGRTSANSQKRRDQHADGGRSRHP